MNTDLLEQLETSMRRRMAAMPSALRPFTLEDRALPRGLVLTGQRGVGKTTFLLHHLRGQSILYASADNPLLADVPLYDLAHDVFLRGYGGIAIDEVHYAREWSRNVKAVYDDYPDRVVWVSDSSSLVLRSGTADLSRRLVPLRMPLLSFREFLELRTGSTYPVFDPTEDVPVSGAAELLSLYHEYRRHGTRPFHVEGNYAERMLGILEKTLQADVPFFVPQITDTNIRLMNAIVATLARAPVPRLQVRSLCADWGVGAEKLYQLLFVMESVGVVRIIRKPNDRKAGTVGEKIFFGDPTFYDVLGGNQGTAREALFVAMLQESGRRVEASPDERLADFVLDGSRTVEVGGRSKDRKGADIVVRDDLDVPSGSSLPLWTFGFLY
jgi:uncharacterized protein